MADAGSRDATHTVGDRPDELHRYRRRRRPLARTPTRPLPRQVEADELGKRIAALPSRQHMARPRPKADLVEHTRRFYNALHSWGYGARSAHFRCSWRQLIRACGYEDTAAVQRSVERYAQLLRELGLADVHGVKDRAGAWRCLEVRLLAPPELAELGDEPRPIYEARRASGGRRRRMGRVGAPRAGRAARRAFKCVSRAGSKEGATPRGVRAPAPGSATYSNLRSPLGVGPFFESPNPPGERERVNRGVLESSKSDANEPAITEGAARGAAPDGLNNGPRGRERALTARLLRTFMDHGGPVALAEAVSARRQGENAVELVCALWRVLRFPEPGAGPERREQLQTALARCERYAAFGRGDRGAGVELAGQLMLAHADEDDGPRLRSLAGIAAAIDSTGRRWRRAELVRRGELDPGRQRDGIPWTPKRPPRGWEWPPEW